MISSQMTFKNVDIDIKIYKYKDNSRFKRICE